MVSAAVERTPSVEPRPRAHTEGLGWLDPSLWLFVAFSLTALVGLWAAYDPALAWPRYLALNVGLFVAAGVAWAGRTWGDRALATGAAGCALLTLGISLYFLLSHDWRSGIAMDSTTLQQLGVGVQTLRPDVTVPEDIHPNTAASALIFLLPLALGGAGWLWTRAGRGFAILMGLSLLPGLFALLLTSSRGAWGAMAAACLLALYADHRATDAGPRPRRLADAALLAGVALLVGGGVFMLRSTALDPWLQALPAGATALSRVALWRDMLVLIEDYPFTGSGLGTTTMVLSTYVLLLHVPYISHAHNVFLQIAVEQGIPGLLAFMGLLIVALRSLQDAYPRRGADRWLLGGTVAALCAMLLHGLTDAPGYATRLVPLFFLPIGFALGQAPASRQRLRPGATWLVVPRRWVVALLALLAGLCSWSGALAQLHSRALSNLGSVAQTRVELAVYEWPAWGVQDEVRLAHAEALGPAHRWFDAALRADPSNATAHRRVGQIALAHGDVATAHHHLIAAHLAAPQQRPTRQLLGESYAIQGLVDEAAHLWKIVDGRAGQFALRHWWYKENGHLPQAAWIEQAMTRASGPHR